MVARLARNQKVRGSNPFPGPTPIKYTDGTRGRDESIDGLETLATSDSLERIEIPQAGRV